MADTLGMDPARIERLRSPERLEYFHPDRIWEVLKPAPDCTLIDIGAGVGFVTLPFAAAFPPCVTVTPQDGGAQLTGDLQGRLLDELGSLLPQCLQKGGLQFWREPFLGDDAAVESAQLGFSETQEAFTEELPRTTG